MVSLSVSLHDRRVVRKDTLKAKEGVFHATG